MSIINTSVFVKDMGSYLSTTASAAYILTNSVTLCSHTRSITCCGDMCNLNKWRFVITGSWHQTTSLFTIRYQCLDKCTTNSIYAHHIYIMFKNFIVLKRWIVIDFISKWAIHLMQFPSIEFCKSQNFLCLK